LGAPASGIGARGSARGRGSSDFKKQKHHINHENENFLTFCLQPAIESPSRGPFFFFNRPKFNARFFYGLFWVYRVLGSSSVRGGGGIRGNPMPVFFDFFIAFLGVFLGKEF
jgi:hypothetical protein